MAEILLQKFIIEKFPFRKSIFSFFLFKVEEKGRKKLERIENLVLVLKINENKSFFHSIFFAINLRNWSNFSNKCSEVLFCSFFLFHNKIKTSTRTRKNGKKFFIQYEFPSINKENLFFLIKFTVDLFFFLHVFTFLIVKIFSWQKESF
jgi:hypothetical protein